MTKNILVVGASRGTGRAVVTRLLADGHRVTAFGRTASAELAGLQHDGLTAFDGDVLDPDAVGKAMVGQDAVVVTLGISDSPLKVRLLRRAGTALDVRSRGTAVVLDAMRDHGVRRLVVQTTYGLGDSFARMSLTWKLTFRLLLAPQIADSERQEALVRGSRLDWTVVRPVGLTDEAPGGSVQVADNDEVGSFAVSRDQVASVIADAVGTDDRVGRVLSVSTAP